MFRSLLSILFLVSATIISHAQTITTFAGNGNRGYSGDGGKAINASFNNPAGVVFDRKGNLLIPDAGNFVIRKIDTAGVVSTLAGNGSIGYSGDGGPAILAQFASPAGIATDAAGNIYICDWNNNAVRKIDSLGIIRTIAGTGMAGYSGDGGPAVAAKLKNPAAITLDHYGNLYVCDWSNFVVRKIDTNGIITTFAGNGLSGYSGDGGKAVKASLFQPYGISADTNNNIYIADEGNFVIRKVDTAGIITTIAGKGIPGFSGDGGPAVNAQLVYPQFVTSLSGDLFICDKNNIRKIDSNKIINSIAGNNTEGYSGDGGPAFKAQLRNPLGVTADGFGNLYIADAGNNVIRKISSCALQTPVKVVDTLLCPGASILLPGGQLVNKAGSYVSELIAVSGCDSLILFYHVSADSLQVFTKKVFFCNGTAVLLTAAAKNTYLWNDGSKQDSLSTSQPGTYTVAVTDSAGCTAVDSFLVKTFPQQPLSLSPKTQICYGDSINAGSGFSVYQWNTGFSGASIPVTVPGNYDVTVTDSSGCMQTDSVKITTVMPIPAGFLITDTVICINGSITLSCKQEFAEYRWSTGSTTAVSQIREPGNYQLSVTDFTGCIATDTVTVTAVNCYDNIRIPGAFSPNGDGINDVWAIADLDKYPQALVEVFNRYGQPVFQASGYHAGNYWDGKYNGRVLPVGTYYYLIKVDQYAKPIAGSVTIVR